MPSMYSGGAGNVASAQIIDGTIVNDDINAAAGINFSKITGTIGAGASASNFVVTNVLNASNAYSAWADLNLSAVVGGAARVVLLRVNSSYAGQWRAAVRTKGDANEYNPTANSLGMGSNVGGSSYYSTQFIVKTDTAGIIQAIVSAGNLTIDVLAWW